LIDTGCQLIDLPMTDLLQRMQETRREARAAWLCVTVGAPGHCSSLGRGTGAGQTYPHSLVPQGIAHHWAGEQEQVTQILNPFLTVKYLY